MTNGVYGRIKRSILTARIMPGTVVGEREMAAELGVSRTPVREAIARLVSEWLLRRRASRGYVVPAMGPQEAADFYAVREALEALAVRLALRRMTPVDVRRLETEVETLARVPADKSVAGAGRPGIRVHDLLRSHIGRARDNLVRVLTARGDDRSLYDPHVRDDLLQDPLSRDAVRGQRCADLARTPRAL